MHFYTRLRKLITTKKSIGKCSMKTNLTKLNLMWRRRSFKKNEWLKKTAQKVFQIILLTKKNKEIKKLFKQQVHTIKKTYKIPN